MKFLILIASVALISCQQISNPNKNEQELYLGGDLSYINEVEDCGGKFRSEGKQVDPFQLFGQKGANIVRVRIWHSPDWTQYSGFKDVVKTIQRSRQAGMKVLLDFHYSDTWADPGDQIIPAAWKNIVDLDVLGDSVYNYTYKIVNGLALLGLTPEFVQVGNETNSEILLNKHVDELTEPINWQRNVFLLNRGLQAVNDVSAAGGVRIQTMLHIAQPEFAFPWFQNAFNNGINNFDWIGLSYYPLWSTYKISEAASAVDSLKKLFNKRIMIVETAYPYVIKDFDEANNILGETAVLSGYPATPKGQLKYMVDLTNEVLKGGAEGVIYWEPAWISTSCSTRWGKGSHWENAIFFDAANSNESLPVFDFLDRRKYQNPNSEVAYLKQ
jgi:arabinogalactan endo-1,4-beta-galactosidase